MPFIASIRHAMADAIGVGLSGRKEGVHLNEAGKREADALANRLSQLPIRALFSSPLERAVETAGPMSGRLGIEPRINDLLTEVDFGSPSI